MTTYNIDNFVVQCVSYIKKQKQDYLLCLFPLSLMNSFNKTEASIPPAGYAFGDFPFSSY